MTPIAGTHRVPSATEPADPQAAAKQAKTREAFNQFVGTTFYGQMLQSMRKTVGKSAYFDGGRAEEIFQQRLDETLADTLTKASSDRFTGPMFELFMLRRA